MHKSNAIERMSALVSEIEDNGLCLKDDKWQPTKELLDILIENAENLGVSIRKSHSSIVPEDLEPIFNKMNVWMGEIIDLKKENDIYRHTVNDKDEEIVKLNDENALLRKKIEELENKNTATKKRTTKTTTRKRATAPSQKTKQTDTKASSGNKEPANPP